MAYDGNPELYVKPDVFSLEGLAAWLETQDGATEYSYSDIGDCLLCRYFRCVGKSVRRVSPAYWVDTNGDNHKYPSSLDEAAASIEINGFKTYAAALDRCRALIAEGK